MDKSRLELIKVPDLGVGDGKKAQACGVATPCACTDDEDTVNISKEHIANEDKRDKEEQILIERLKDSQQNREQRKQYANKIFWLVCAWLVVLVIIVGQAGCGRLILSDSVLIALISGASINIIGLMVIVANYLFPKNGGK